MTKEEIEYILLQLSDRIENERDAVVAFNLLYRGYSKFLSSVISASLRNSGIYEKHLVDTVLNNTFLIIYEKPLSFSFPPGAVDDNRFKAWLATVARNELKRLLMEYYSTTVSLALVTCEPVADSEELAEEVFEGVNFKILDDALNTLSERDKNILQTLYLFYEEGKKTPSDVLYMICKMYDTTNPNIRKIKERSEKKIAEYFIRHSQLIPLKNVK